MSAKAPVPNLECAGTCGQACVICGPESHQFCQLSSAQLGAADLPNWLAWQTEPSRRRVPLVTRATVHSVVMASLSEGLVAEPSWNRSLRRVLCV